MEIFLQRENYNDSVWNTCTKNNLCETAPPSTGSGNVIWQKKKQKTFTTQQKIKTLDYKTLLL